MDAEYYCGLPFVTVNNERMTNMTIGEVVEGLIQIKKDNDIRYPYDEAINNACNILDRLPITKNVYEWIKENDK
jgi:hypothetical protein